MALSPFPEIGTRDYQQALTQLAAVLGLSEPADDALTRRLGGAASALVEAHAPSAPQVVRDEATNRCAGWLLDAPSSGLRSQAEGDIRQSFTPAATGALRASGAMSLLRPWTRRRAGAIG